MASVTSLLKLSSVTEAIPHTNSLEWLRETAEYLVEKTLMPPPETESSLHRSFLHTTFLYVDLRDAIRFEHGPQIIRLWKLWLPRLIGTGRNNYAVECVNLLGNLYADFPPHISYIAMHNRTVNTTGKAGHGKPIDQMVEHYNL